MAGADRPDPDTNSRWLEHWEQQDTGWHIDKVHPALAEHVGEWTRVFVPLCGATLDLRWLAERGMEVHGSELSPIACKQAFEGWAEPETDEIVTADGTRYTDYTARGVTLHCGDLFALPKEHTGVFDGVWDRGAMVALPDELRIRYVRKLSELAPGADLLLSVFQYDPSVMTGPPFSIAEAFIREHLDGVQLLDENTSPALFRAQGVVERTYRARLRP